MQQTQDVRLTGGAGQISSSQTWARTIWLAAMAVAIAANGQAPSAPGAANTSAPRVLRSPRFVLHTDLPQPEAEGTLARMESTVKKAAAYWRTEPRGQIDCYVAQDLDQWADSALPHKLARVWIGGVGGATISEYKLERGKVRVRATVYASTAPGIVEHEVVHAYCFQAFGDAGPDWYKEGMAQSVACALPLSRGCPAELATALGHQPSQSIDEIVRAGRFSRDLNASFGAMLADRKPSDRHVSMTHWGDNCEADVKRMKAYYARSWSLCHLLLYNSNYSARFRMLGKHCLSGKKLSFHDAFGAVADKLAFEYDFFLRHVSAGYRVDLCQWDWEERFRTLGEQRTICQRIQAARGFQPTGLRVVGGYRYAYATQGRWSISPSTTPTDANGCRDGRGRMVGVIMADCRLGETFELGSKGSFVAPASGDLYARCRDGWGQLGDNFGEIILRLSKPEREKK